MAIVGVVYKLLLTAAWIAAAVASVARAHGHIYRIWG
jgi:hypothetical protein